MGCVRPPGGEQGVGASLDADPHSLPPGGRRSVHGPPAALVAPGARGRRVPSAVLVRPFPTLPFLCLRCETCGAVGKGSVCFTGVCPHADTLAAAYGRGQRGSGEGVCESVFFALCSTIRNCRPQINTSLSCVTHYYDWIFG